MTNEQPTIHVGIDVSKDKLAVAIASGGVRDEVLSWGTFENTPASVDRLLKKLSGRGLPISVCYEAGPTGYGLYRQVRAFGFECCVVAPSLIPVRAGERVKTDRLDAIRLARLLRAGELTPIWVPDETHEAMRDLVRARESAAEDQRHKRQLVSAFMLRHGRIYHRTKPWTMRYRRWLQSQNFDHQAHQIALQEMLQAERNASERLDRLTGHIEALVPEWDLAPTVNALQALRGVALISAVTFMAEIGDVRRFESKHPPAAVLLHQLCSLAMMFSMTLGSHCSSRRNSRMPPSHVRMSARSSWRHSTPRSVKVLISWPSRPERAHLIV